MTTITAAPTLDERDQQAADRRRLLTRLSGAAALWGLGYATYRGYYAAGGTFGIPGVPASSASWRLVNLVGALIIAAGAALPIAALPFWTRRRTRALLLAICWLVAVFCCMHALVMMTERVLSLTGHLHIDYPKTSWTTHSRRRADLQDLFGNEPWFFLEGIAYAAVAWVVMTPSPTRRRWIAAGSTAVALLTAVGLLSVTGVIGKAIVA